MFRVTHLNVTLDRNTAKHIAILTNAEMVHALAIPVTADNATRIELALSKIRPIPPSLDLVFLEFLRQLDKRLSMISIDVSPSGLHFGRLHYSKSTSDTELAHCCLSDPVDAVILALRSGAPFFISDAALTKDALPNFSFSTDDAQKFQQFIDHVKATDFKF